MNLRHDKKKRFLRVAGAAMMGCLFLGGCDEVPQVSSIEVVDPIKAGDLSQVAALAPLDSVQEFQTQVNTFTSSQQTAACLTKDPAGGLVVAWESRRQQEGMYGVYLQRFSDSGARLGGETQINLYTKGMQRQPALAGDAKGIWAAWESFGQDRSLGSIVARRFTLTNGGLVGGDEILVNENIQGHQYQAVVASDKDGNATFAWTTPASKAEPQKVVFRKFGADGKPLNSETPVSHSKNNQGFPSLAINDQNQIVVVWAETSSKNIPTAIRGCVMTNEATTGESFLISDTNSKLPIEPTVSISNEGNIGACWLEPTQNDFQLKFASFNSAGKRISQPLQLSQPADERVSSAAIHAEGANFVVAWNSKRQGELTKTHPEDRFLINAQRIASTGTLRDKTIQVAAELKSQMPTSALETSGKQRIATDANGNLAFTWHGTSVQDDSAVCLTTLAKSERYRFEPPTESQSGSSNEVASAKPHEPPTFDPKQKAKDRFGGDPQPFAREGGDFGFIGITATGWTPPDPTIAVGPNHLVATTNGEIAFFTKDGTLTFQDEIENSFGFWGSLGTENFVFDPEVIFDPHSGRFFAMANERASIGSTFLLAVSDDDDPNGNWNKYRFDVTSLADTNIDSPNLAVDDEAVYLTADFFGPNRYLIFMVDKADVIAGVANPSATDILVTGTQSYGLAMNYDANAPATYMISGAEFQSSTSFTLHALRNPLTNPTRVTTSVTVPQYGHPVDPVSMGTSSRPELFESRFWSCVYRNGSLWAVHHQSPTGTEVARVTWYEFDMAGWPESGNSPTLVQSGQINPDANTYTFFPSIWVDDAGNAAITFAKSSANEFISMCRAVRKAGDPLGTFRPFVVVRENAAAYSVTRWGDYSGTMNDPAEPGTFWGIHEYSPGNNSWNTWIAKYELPIDTVSFEPDSFVKVRGRDEGGSFQDILASDDSYLQYKQVLTRNPNAARIQIVVDGTTPIASPTSISFSIETKANNAEIDQRIEVFNFTTNSYEFVQNGLTQETDTVTTVELTGNMDDYVSGSGGVRARIGWRGPGDLVRLPRIVDIDHVFWTVE